jgi:hypothetical protein
VSTLSDNSKVFFVHAIKTRRRRRGRDPLILNADTGGRRVDLIPLLLSSGERDRVPIE